MKWKWGWWDEAMMLFFLVFGVSCIWHEPSNMALGALIAGIGINVMSIKSKIS